MKPRRFDLIAFDWDGTLSDSTAMIARCIQDACRDVGAAVPTLAQASYVIGLGLRDALAHAAPDVPSERYPELAQAYRRHYLARQEDLSLFEGSVQMLRDLKLRNHWLAVATGKTRRGLDDALRHAELAGVFDTSRTADETASKPDPLMLHELMMELDVPPERVLMVGDTTHDLLMAANAGVASVGVSFGAHDHAAFEAHAPLYVAHSTAQLHQWLLQHG